MERVATRITQTAALAALPKLPTKTMLRILLAIAIALPLFATAQAASAQARHGTLPTEARPAGGRLTFEAFSRDMQAAADEAGIEITEEQIRETFEAADASGDGQLESGEAARGRAPTRCSGRGVCRHGACFCTSGHQGSADGADNGTLQEEEAATESFDNPIFHDGTGAQQNVLAE